MHVPTFFMFLLNTKAPEYPFLILFQQDLFAAYQEIAPEITGNVMKYYVQHACQWLSMEECCPEWIC